MAFSKTAEEILKFLVNNLIMNNEEENYPRNISRELGISQAQLNNHLRHLENISVVKRVREGQKKIVYVNSGIVEGFKKRKNLLDEKTSSSDSSPFQKINIRP
ncbi:MAG: ArsR family transcriptional regulator [Methanonatronarchaeia archaeon]|nr:MAG: ArsR family transcriptional regulator [Methanonatronarchaeia archaeon]